MEVKILRLFSWMRSESAQAVPAIIYFAITFNLVHLSQVLNHSPGERWLTGFFGATFGALIAGKVVIVANHFPFVNRFVTRPLIYHAVWKFMIFGFVAIIAQLLDVFVRNVYRVDWVTGFHEVAIYLQLPRFWSVQIWILFLFFIYVVFNEMIRVIGRKECRRVFFG